MAMRTLVEIGAMPKLRTGPIIAKSPEEAKRIQSECCKRRKALIDGAIAQGIPPPVFRMGRPRKYTPDEARAVKKAQLKLGKARYQDRLRQGVENIKKLGLHLERTYNIRPIEPTA